MRTHLLLTIFCLAGIVSLASAQKNVTIPQLNMVPLDSLLKMDQLQSAAATALDETQTVRNNDTVRVTGVVLVKPRILTYTLARYNIFIQDTTTGAIFAGLNVLTNDTSEAAQTTQITAIDTGDVITIVGRALEFGTQPNSLTEMYIYSTSAPAFTSPVAVEIVKSGSRPAPLELAVDSFAVGTQPRPSRGEKYEGMYVVIRNVTVNSVDLSSGRFTFVDAAGNQMQMYDGSGYYTLRGHRYSNSRYTAPPVGTKLSYIRGIIIPQARTGTAGDYTIMPLYPGPSQLNGSTYAGDMVIDKFAPSITALTRTPGLPLSSSSVSVTFKASNLNTGATIDSAALYYKVDSGTFTRLKLTLAVGDSLYRAQIPAQANNSLVSYYAEAYGSEGSTGTFPDATVPYFYRVRDNGLTVYDLQYTPYVNGRPGFVGDTVTVSGVVTADTTDLKETVSNPRLYIAESAGAWKGIAIYGNGAGVRADTLARGDSVTVTGILRENFSKTEIQVLSKTVHAKNKAVPGPTTISISGSGSVSYSLSNPPVDGNATFEQWEGVLVQINNPYIIGRNADNPNNGSGSNFGEFFIGSSATTTFGLRVNDNGVNRYYADTSASYTAKPSNAILLPLRARLSFIRGIFDYSFSFYKLEPRKDDDFGTVTSVETVDLVPGRFELSQNYPNPFNPSTTIRYSIPVSGRVTLKVFNVLGQEVASVVNADQMAGTFMATFDASRLSTGVYIYQLRVSDFMTAKKMVLLK